MKFDTMNIILFAMSIALGITYMSLRNARKQREKKAQRRIG